MWFFKSKLKKELESVKKELDFVKKRLEKEVIEQIFDEDSCPVLESAIEVVEEEICPFSGNKCKSGSFVICKHFWTCVNQTISQKKE